MSQFQVKVSIRLRPSVLDPAGEAVKSGANRLGVENISSLRIGKLIELTLNDIEEGEAKEKVELLCERLFSNNVIEDYEYSLKKINE